MATNQGSSWLQTDFSLTGLKDRIAQGVQAVAPTSFLSGLGTGTTTNTRGFNTRSFFNATPSAAPSTDVAATGMGYFAQMGTYLFSILIVLAIILLFVHFFITPVFQLHPGGPGVIPVPGTDDGVLFWNSVTPDRIPNASLPIVSQSFGYTVNVDMFIENPFQFASTYRLLFRRSDTATPVSQTGSIHGFLQNYNLAAVLLPDRNDLVVSVLTSDNNSNDILIPNVPIQETFRLGMVVLENAMEVYLNGKLIQTKTFASPPKAILGDIYTTIASEPPVAKLQNLKIWSRVLTTPEIRYAKPPMPAASSFGPISLPSMDSCST